MSEAIELSHLREMLVLGLMSGTSCDGLDMAVYRMKVEGKRIAYEIVAAQTAPYSGPIQQALKSLSLLSGEQLARWDIELADYWAGLVSNFLNEEGLFESVELISSHGHTVFHQPQHGLSLQIGSGARLATKLRKAVVCDFRQGDIAAGGQGAPLAPALDEALFFEEYDGCLNIGGFANITLKTSQLGFDVCPANIVLNRIANDLGQPFDNDGDLARRGIVSPALLKGLHEVIPVSMGARSLGVEDVARLHAPILQAYNEVNAELPVAERALIQLATYTRFVAQSIAHTIILHGATKVLVTGGGALNLFLMEEIQRFANEAGKGIRVEAGSESLIHFKEALLMAYLGWKRWHGLPNTPAWATGASRSISSGAVYLGF